MVVAATGLRRDGSRKLQPSQWRTKLVGDVSQERFSIIVCRLHTLEGSIELASDLADLVMSEAVDVV